MLAITKWIMREISQHSVGGEPPPCGVRSICWSIDPAETDRNMRLILRNKGNTVPT